MDLEATEYPCNCLPHNYGLISLSEIMDQLINYNSKNNYKRYKKKLIICVVRAVRCVTVSMLLECFAFVCCCWAAAAFQLDTSGITGNKTDNTSFYVINIVVDVTTIIIIIIIIIFFFFF